MSEEIQKIVASLPGMNDVNNVRDLVEQRVQHGDAAFAADLGIALFNAYGSANTPMWQYRSVSDAILRLLVITAGPEHLGHALRLIGASCADDRKRARYAASLLASNRSAQDLTGIFAGGSPGLRGSEELRACLIHELVLRGEPVHGLSAIAGWATSPHWAYHPLGWLPLSRSSVEANLTLPNYGVRGSSYAIPFGPAYDRETVPPPPAGNGSIPTASETTTPETAILTSRAVANWAAKSNGRIEARSFALDAPAGSLSALLPTLKLACLTDDKRKPTVSVDSCDAARVWRILFAAASTGGAYNHGLYGAYGRLEAWKSMAGLTGSADTDAFADIERRVREHRWFALDTSTPWFDQVAWDIGIAALSPDRQTVTVLAATDTD